MIFDLCSSDDIEHTDFRESFGDPTAERRLEDASLTGDDAAVVNPVNRAQHFDLAVDAPVVSTTVQDAVQIESAGLANADADNAKTDITSSITTHGADKGESIEQPQQPQQPPDIAPTTDCVSSVVADEVPSLETNPPRLKPDTSVARLVEQANHSAGKLVNILVKCFPSFRDETRFNGRKVRLYKRAQIFVADLWAAFNGTGYGEFDDIGHLTMFAGRWA